MRRLLIACGISIALMTTAVAADAPKEKSSQPVITDQKPRIAYVAFRILDLDRSLHFYTGLLGMKERTRIPLGNGVSEILLGYGNADQNAGILLLYDTKRKEPYTHGDAFHRFIINVNDLPGLVAHLKSNDAKITREPTRVENLKLSYAFVSDPDGYTIELVQSD